MFQALLAGKLCPIPRPRETMGNELLILLLLYLTPIGGFFLAQQCGKEPRQGEKIFEILYYGLMAILAFYVAGFLHPLILLFALILYLPLYWKARAMAGAATMGFLYGLSALDATLLYPASVLLILYGLVEGTLYTLRSKHWKGLLAQQLPFLVMALVALFSHKL